MNKLKLMLLPAACALALLGGCADTPDSPSASSVTAIPNPPAAKVAEDVADDCDEDQETGSHYQRHTVCMSQNDRNAQDHAMDNMRARGAMPAQGH